ncbi:type II secretory pathway predicted ATPase ExeA [Duganella sp. 3397]|uniref:ExeA family protein n=1 Tax=Duganella sp. 3397 TaxID=2817732 RepID=UPI002864F978|nr:AAA family ATPase [Duganella sp. 3397]MDR7049283.1 type II secretory pathway predicted ATPase ExeA [Duganella sp. 3397]
MTTSAMYQQHFGLRESPFGITPNPAFFYAGNTRGEILEALLYAVCHGEGIVKVTGEVGAGKTMLCRMLESRLPGHIEVIYLVNPNLDPVEVQYAIAAELGLATRGYRVDEIQRAVHTHLIALHGQGRNVVLLVEEAQAMPLATLEAIRLLTNLETASSKLLQIVLFGQPELDRHLDLPSMRQLKERITHSFEVPALASSLVAEFLAFRLAAAGHGGAPVFSNDAVRLIGDASEGIVRRINVLADKALLAAFADDAGTVEARHARLAIAESPYRSYRTSRLKGLQPRTVVTACLLCLVFVAICWSVLATASEL